MATTRCKVVLLALSLVCQGAFADQPSGDSVKAEVVSHLKPESAESDARVAVAHGDRRLLAVYGYTIEVPGVRTAVTELKARYGLRMLEGTSDSYQSPGDQKLNENARRYASIYNRTVISQSTR